MLLAPLLCELGCCSRTVVVIKAAARAVGPAATVPYRNRKWSQGATYSFEHQKKLMATHVLLTISVYLYIFLLYFFFAQYNFLMVGRIVALIFLVWVASAQGQDQNGDAPTRQMTPNKLPDPVHEGGCTLPTCSILCQR